jgi:anaerobic magnesium-protoporphyrin IX monomethyl ester cyclase
MRILLLSMPDSFEHTPALAIRMPNGALTSLAGNVDAHHQVAVADLVDPSAGADRGGWLRSEPRA